MPLYDFKCNSCEFFEEKICKSEDLNEMEGYSCPSCSEGKMKRTWLSMNHVTMDPTKLGRKKAPQDFRDFLGAIHKAHGKDSQIRVH